VVLYDSNNVRQAKVFFGASPVATPFATFDNSVGADNVNLATLSAVGTNGAFVALTDADEIGSPGTTVSPAQNDTTIVISDASLSEGSSGSSTLSFTVTRSDRNGSLQRRFRHLERHRDGWQRLHRRLRHAHFHRGRLRHAECECFHHGRHRGRSE
jgi:hypothetical protein